MKRKFLILSIFMFLLLGNLSFGQGASYVGTSVANFLKIGLSAKAVAIAESDLNSIEDASVLYLNPATMSRFETSSVSFSYIQWLVQSQLSYFAFNLPTELGSFGLDIVYFGSGDIMETTLLRQDGTGRVVSTSDVSIGLAYARNLTDRFSVGLKIKYITERLASVSASTFAFDLGSVFETSILNRLKIGITLSNFGGSLRFEGNDLLVTQTVPGSTTNKQIPAILQTYSWDLPLLFRIGVSTNVLDYSNYKARLSYMLIDSRDYNVRHNLGLSMNLYDLFTLRGGYRFNYDEATFSAGFGIKTKTDFLGEVLFDYAFTDFGRLKGINQFTLSINF